MWLLEVGSSCAIFFTLILSTILPYFYLLRGSKNNSRTSSSLSICNCLACGIFLSTCFLGLIPHVRHQETMLRANETKLASCVNCNSTTIDTSLIPSTESVVLLGFLLILLIEQVLMLFSSHSHHHHHHASSSPHRAPTLRTLLENDGEDGQPLVDTTLDDDDGMQDIVFRSSSPATEVDEVGGGGHSHMIPIEDGLTARTLFLLLGLSIHSVFEGVALGVQNQQSDFFNVLVAIMFHEVLCCFAYGVSMAQQKTPVKSAFLTTIILSATIPMGMLFAFMVNHADSADSMVLRFILEGLAAGTFVYVACVEMLSAELQHSHGHSHSESRCAPLTKALAVTAGVAIFWILKNAFGNHH